MAKWSRSAGSRASHSWARPGRPAWVLHYTDDPDRVVAEMARAVDREHPEA
ncbi:hypothetical protein ACIQZO_30650 [Streptomyces sp. NPDC097617]|uniref:hypothetical protein n=1 Tax=Streptomyces sp. NPDC097617 TaxID=3366091 RepID=UPI003804569C